MKLVNLTPHTVTIVDSQGKKLSIPPEGVVPRVQELHPHVGELNYEGVQIPLVRAVYPDGQAVQGLPEPQPGVLLLVSRMVFDACPNRTDLAVPDTSPGSVIRDEAGRITGVRQLIVRQVPTK